MNLTDIINNTNTYIGDISTDRLTDADRFAAMTEATAWLLEELGNEHMVDRVDIEYLPTVTWYKMDNLTPYLLTAGQLRFKNEEDHITDFTRIEARDLALMSKNRTAYTIERFNSDSYLGITIPNSTKYPHLDLIPFNKDDGLTYTGTNTTNIIEEDDAVRFDMLTDGVAATGLTTTSSPFNIDSFSVDGVLIVEVEIPDITDVTSITIKFGTDLSTDYYSGTVAQDINGNTLVEGVNTVKVNWADLILIGTPDLTAMTKWSVNINHEVTKPAVEGFKISDLRIASPVMLTFKYIFYRVGKTAAGADIIEFTSATDVPFFIDRYPQYRFAVAHKAAGTLFRSLQLKEEAYAEDREATQALKRFRKNFSAERDTASSTFKPAGVRFNRRQVRRRI